MRWCCYGALYKFTVDNTSAKFHKEDINQCDQTDWTWLSFVRAVLTMTHPIAVKNWRQTRAISALKLIWCTLPYSTCKRWQNLSELELSKQPVNYYYYYYDFWSAGSPEGHKCAMSAVKIVNCSHVICLHITVKQKCLQLCSKRLDGDIGWSQRCR